MLIHCLHYSYLFSFHDIANLESCLWTKRCHTLEVLIHSNCVRFALTQFQWKRILLLLFWQYVKIFQLHHSQKLFSCTSCWKLSYKFCWVTSNIYCCPARCGSNACKKRSLKNFYFLECVVRFMKLFIRRVIIEWKRHHSTTEILETISLHIFKWLS